MKAKHSAKSERLAGRKIQISVSLPIEVIKELRRRAAADHRSISNYVHQHVFLPYLEEMRQEATLPDDNPTAQVLKTPERINVTNPHRAQAAEQKG